MVFKEHVYMEEASNDGDKGGGGTPQGEEWKKDPNLDENGNVKEVVDKGTENTDPAEKGSKGEKEDKPTTDETTETPEKVDFTAPAVKQAETLITSAGLDAAEVTRAFIDNDGVMPLAMMQALVKKHGDAVSGLLAAQLGTMFEATKAKAAAKDQGIFKQVEEAFKGKTEQTGKESWAELAGWAKDNVPNAERAEINKLLSQGGLAATFAVKDLIDRFNGQAAVPQDAELLNGDSANKVYGATGISAQEYSMELRKLSDSGHVYGKSSEMDKLDKRREAGRRAGL